MAFNRSVNLEILSAGNSLVTISNLNIDFEISRTLTLSDNTASFTIYNAKENTRNNILRKGLINGTNLVFKAGYLDERNVNTIFFGTIDSSISYKENTEIITKIVAFDIGKNDQKFEFKTVQYNYKAGTSLASIIYDVAGIYGVAIFGIENVTSVLNNGFKYVGSIGGLLKEIEFILMANELKFYFDSNQMIIYRPGTQISSFGVINIGSKNVIGSVEEFVDENKKDTKKRIKLTTLMNCKLKPNALINLEGENIQGLYIIEKARFYGNNYGGDFAVEIIGVE